MSGILIHDLLARSAARQGDRAALVDGDRVLSYRELEAASNRVARLLQADGVAPGDRVGLYLEKSIEAVVALYGVLKAGAAYVPMDDQGPIERLGHIARNAGLAAIVTSAARRSDALRMIAGGAPARLVLVTDPDGGPAPDAGVAVRGWAELDAFDAQPLPGGADEHAPAYILYTSGSTGVPKGVVLSHRNCLAFVEWAADLVDAVPADRFSSHAPLHFDLSTFDLFAAALSGATLVLIPRDASVFPSELARIIREHRITVWYSVPSILSMLALRGGLEDAPLPDLRVVVFAGEVFPAKHLARLTELVPHARYLNFYGPTETNVCTWYEVPPGTRVVDDLPIGRPIADTVATVAGPDNEPVARGDVGELLITGPTVMRGYWGDDAQTARVLIRGEEHDTYRTGDLVRVDDAGELRFVGRKDHQVKTRGYRVELGEIESVLHSLDVVVEAAVVAVPDETVTSRLRAFVVTNAPVSVPELRRLCRDRLPQYMIPDAIEFRSELPKTSTGKVDRQHLLHAPRENR